MNLDKLFAWIIGLMITCVITGQLHVLQKWIWQSQVYVVHESRASNWGTPRFFKEK